MSNFVPLSIRSLLDGYRAKKFKPSEVVATCLSEIEKKNPKLNAFLEVRSDVTVKRAQELDAKISDAGTLPQESSSRPLPASAESSLRSGPAAPSGPPSWAPDRRRSAPGGRAPSVPAPQARRPRIPLPARDCPRSSGSGIVAGGAGRPSKGGVAEGVPRSAHQSRNILPPPEEGAP